MLHNVRVFLFIYNKNANLTINNREKLFNVIYFFSYNNGRYLILHKHTSIESKHDTF